MTYKVKSLILTSLFISAYFFNLTATSEEVSSYKNEEGEALTNLENEPSSLVYGCVNVITGRFCESETDLVVHHGVDPLYVHRSFAGESIYEGNLASCWNRNHSSEVLINKRSGKDKQISKLTLNSDHCGALTFEREGLSRGLLNDLSAKNSSFFRAVTNTSQGCLSGQTNIRNHKIQSDTSDSCLLLKGSCNVMSFQLLGDNKKNKNDLLRLTKDIKESGNQILYDYDSSSTEGELTRVTICNRELNEGGALNFPTSRIKKMSQDLQYEITTQDGRFVRYHYYKKDKGISLISRVVRSDAPPVNYEYLTRFVSNSGISFITKKTMPQNRVLAAQYYLGALINIPGTKVKFNPFDARGDRVKTLLAPAGKTAELVPIYTFYYYLDEHEKKMNGITHDFKKGSCSVFDALDRKIDYTFNNDHRLTKIVKFNKGSVPYTEENLYWGNNKSSELSFLVSRSFQEENNPVFAREYTYDEAGNVLVDTLYGNLTGDNEGTFKINSDGTIEDRGCEFYEKNQTYSKEGHNLLLTESEGALTTTYRYEPQTHNIIAKFQSAEGKIFSRSFYTYNQDAALIKEIVDDGDGEDSDDLNHVTERHITYITQSETYPRGYPLIIEKKYYDFELGEEVSSHSVINTYTKKAQIASQEHFDSRGVLCYTLYSTYNDFGKVIEEGDALNRITTRKYDENNNCIYEQGVNKGFYTEYTYDFMNRLTVQKDIHSNGLIFIITHHYDLCGNKVLTIDSYGNETHFIYDAFNRLITTIYPAVQNERKEWVRPTEHKKYNALGQVIVEINPLGVETRMSYTIRGNLMEVHYPDGTVEKNRYHLNGVLKESTSKNGTLTKYFYDPVGRLISTEIHSENTILKTSKVYQGFHLIKEIDPIGTETLFSYFPNGKLKSKQKNYEFTEYAYDTLGRLVKTKEFYSKTGFIETHSSYDFLNHLLEESVTDEQGQLISKVQYTYDLLGHVIEVIQFSSSGVNRTKKNYDSIGNLILIEDGEGNNTVITYDYNYKNSVGQNVPYVEVRDPLGNVSITIKDALQRVVVEAKKDSFGKLIQHKELYYNLAGDISLIKEKKITLNEEDRDIISLLEYDTSRQLTSSYEAFGSKDQKHTQIVYNLLGQKQKVIKHDGTALIYTYDSLCRLSELTASDGSIHYRYTYDLNDNPIRVEDLINKLVTLKTFDSNGCLKGETLGNKLSLHYKNDYLGRITELILPDKSSVAYVYKGAKLKAINRLDINKTSLYTHYYDEYDLSGLLKKATLAGNGGVIEYLYDAVGKIKEISHPEWKEEIKNYDAVGNILDLSLKDAEGVINSNYSYDSLYQLTKEEGGFSHTYLYDSLYNRQKKDGVSHKINDLNQLLDDGLNGYGYDQNGNLIKKRTEETVAYYSYDALDRLKTFTIPGEETHYIYDENNRRLYKKTFYKDEAGTLTLKNNIRYLYQGLNEVGSVDEGGNINELRVLGIGKGAEIGAAVAMELQGGLYIPVHDHLGNVASLLEGTTGDVVECYRYSCFGETPHQSKINPWGFSSKRYDEETGFIYFGRRYYEPKIGRWVTPDPIGREGGQNLYAYVLNNPLSRLDAYGLLGFNFQSNTGFTSLGCAVTEVLAIPGKIIKLAGFHLMPMPYVKDIIEFTGWCLSGNAPSKYLPSWRRGHSKLMKVEGAGNLPSNHAHILYGGMLTSQDTFKEQMKNYSKDNGDITVWGAYNNSDGFVSDMVECFMQKLGLPTDAQRSAEESTRAVVNLMKNAKDAPQIFAQAHSQGAETAYNLSQSLKDVITVNAYAPARILQKKHFVDADNHINRFDIIPYIDPVGVIKGLWAGNIHYLPTCGGPIADHAYDSSNFKDMRRKKGNEYQTKYRQKL